MSYDEFLKTMENVFTSLLFALHDLHWLVQIIEQLQQPSTSSAKTAAIAQVSTASGSVSTGFVKTSDIKASVERELLYMAIDLAHTRCGKVLGMRADLSAQLNCKDFVKLVNLTLKFIQTCENMSSRPCISLRSVISTQVRSLRTILHCLDVS